MFCAKLRYLPAIYAEMNSRDCFGRPLRISVMPLVIGAAEQGAGLHLVNIPVAQRRSGSTWTLESMANTLDKLISSLHANGQDAAFISFSDIYQNEFPKPEIAPVVATLGFAGSCGTVGPKLRPFSVIGREIGAVFVDSRYTVEAAQHFAGSNIATRDLTEADLEQWLEGHPDLSALSADPRLFTAYELQLLNKSAARKNRKLSLDFDFYSITNGYDRTLNTQPAYVLEGEAADETPQSKLADIRRLLQRKKCSLYLTTNNEEVAWLLNLRASENPYLHCSNSWIIVAATGRSYMYFPGDKSLLHQVSSRLDELNIAAISTLSEWLACAEGGRVLADKKRLNGAVEQYFASRGIEIVDSKSPTPMRMSIKSAGEILSSKRAHILDGVAKTRFLHQVHTSATELDEYSAIKTLDSLRRQSNAYLGPSFPWVSCVGPNAAKPHYKPKPDTAIPIKSGSVFLIDSGGQYAGSTTDVTRTVFVGDPKLSDPQFRELFTLVLKGFIGGSSCLLPVNSTAAQLDAITRAPLWARGLDYGHGTGHGVGAGLSIHETPIVISGRGRNFILETGMIFSVEPGFYDPAKWGIRIENLVVVAESRKTLGGKQSIELQPLTTIPIQVDIIERDLLSADEINWLNEYHLKVRSTLAPYLSPEEVAWLEHYSRAI
jgi:Xaa-Pro aminopeptidase